MKSVVHGILLTIPVDHLEICHCVCRWFNKKDFFPHVRSRLEILSRLLMDNFSLLILLYSHQGNYYILNISSMFKRSRLLLISDRAVSTVPLVFLGWAFIVWALKLIEKLHWMTFFRQMSVSEFSKFCGIFKIIVTYVILIVLSNWTPQKALLPLFFWPFEPLAQFFNSCFTQLVTSNTIKLILYRRQ